LRPGLGTLNFKIRFQGVGTKRPNQTVSLILDPRAHGGNLIKKEVIVEANKDGEYSGSIDLASLGVYDIFIKGESHLQRKFVDINISDSFDMFDWTGDVLLAGDFNMDNKISLKDIALFLQAYTQDEILVSGTNMQYDIDFNGVLNSDDLGIILNNFTHLEVLGDF
jgi:hypothetical protein